MNRNRPPSDELPERGARARHPRRCRPGGPRLAALALVLVLTALATACGADGDDGAGAPAPASSAARPSSTETVEPGSATFDAIEYAIDGPGNLPAGLTTVTLENTGTESHHLVFGRLEEGVTEQDFTAAFAALDPTGVATLLGGPNGVPPGGSVSATLALTPGRYLVACFIPGPDGVSHFVKGMSAPLTVDAPDVPAELPASDRTVHLREYDFGRGGTELEGFDGSGTVTVTNEGGEMHEMTIVRLADGASIDQVVDVAELPLGTPRPDPMPFQGVGGVSLLSPGQSARIDLDALGLESGRYALVCFIPSPGDRVTHAAKGMTYEFEISGER